MMSWKVGRNLIRRNVSKRLDFIPRKTGSLRFSGDLTNFNRVLSLENLTFLRQLISKLPKFSFAMARAFQKKYPLQINIYTSFKEH